MMKPQRHSTSLLILGMILIPLGAGLWFVGMALGWDGGGAWTEYLVITGAVMVPAGFLSKLALGAYLSAARNESIPLWYWSDAALVAVLALVMTAFSA